MYLRSGIGCVTHEDHWLGGWGMDSHHGPKRNRDDCLVAERQTAYSLNRLTAVINELSRLIDSRPSSMIERMLADPDNVAEYASAGIEAVHKLRLWRAHHQSLAAEVGADRLCWELTDHPETAFSRRFVPGSPDLDAIRREVWDDNNLGNAIAGATPNARIDVRTLVPGAPLVVKAGRVLPVRTRVHNLSTRAFPAQATYGRRLVRLGAQLCRSDGSLIDRDLARAWLPRTLGPGDRADVPIEVPAPTQTGRYALKFDLVSEGIDWFERCGSPTTLKPLVVR